jgi:hypothetical protein
MGEIDKLDYLHFQRDYFKQRNKEIRFTQKNYKSGTNQWLNMESSLKYNAKRISVLTRKIKNFK